MPAANVADVRNAINQYYAGQAAAPLEYPPPDAALLLGRVIDPPAAGNNLVPGDDVARMFVEYFTFAVDDFRAAGHPRRAAWAGSLARPTQAVTANLAAIAAAEAANNALAPGAAPQAVPNDIRTDADRAVGAGAAAVIAAAPTLSLRPNGLTLLGVRGETNGVAAARVRGVRLGDLLWLYYWERFGLFSMLGTLLGEYDHGGRFPLSGSDDNTVYYEAMLRLARMRQSSELEDREGAYRLCLGWKLDKPPADPKAGVNHAFNREFHRFLKLAVDYYAARDTIAAIQGVNANPLANVATLGSIRDSLQALKNAMRAYDFGRRRTHAIAGIVWAVAGADLIKRVRNDLGVGGNLAQANEYLTAARERLLDERTAVTSYDNHRNCADSGRAILLDIDALVAGGGGNNDYQDDANLRYWLDAIQARVIAYRAAYRGLFNVDVGAGASPVQGIAA